MTEPTKVYFDFRCTPNKNLWENILWRKNRGYLQAAPHTEVEPCKAGVAYIQEYKDSGNKDYQDKVDLLYREMQGTASFYGVLNAPSLFVQPLVHCACISPRFPCNTIVVPK